MEEFPSRNYKNIEEKYVDFLYSIKAINCFKYFEEEIFYRKIQKKTIFHI